MAGVLLERLLAYKYSNKYNVLCVVCDSASAPSPISSHCLYGKLDPSRLAAAYHYKATRSDQAGLRKRIGEIAETRVRFGYRRIWVMLRREAWAVNVKRVDRLWVGSQVDPIQIRKNRHAAPRGAPIVFLAEALLHHDKNLRVDVLDAFRLAISQSGELLFAGAFR